MGAFLRLLLATTLALFANSVNGQVVPRGTVYFLNVPESIKHSGIVMSQTIRPKERARIFWHYKNATGRDQMFTLNVNEKGRNLRVGYAVFDSPPVAGTESMLRFQRIMPSKTPSQLSVRVRVKQGQTISGVAEGVWEQTAFLRARMGIGAEVAGIVKITSPFLFFEKHCHVTSTHMGTIRVGESKTGHIAGDYGSTVRVTATFQGKKTSKIRISFSPRGGPLTLVYRYAGKLYCSSEVSAKSEKRLMDVWLKPGESVSLDVFPMGGFNYPVELRYRVLS